MSDQIQCPTTTSEWSKFGRIYLAGRDFSSYKHVLLVWFFHMLQCRFIQSLIFQRSLLDYTDIKSWTLYNRPSALTWRLIRQRQIHVSIRRWRQKDNAKLKYGIYYLNDLLLVAWFYVYWPKKETSDFQVNFACFETNIRKMFSDCIDL